jgi:hypothetical protein
MDPVTICNMALGWLGAKKITAIVEEEASSVEQELCAIQFPMAVLSCLEERAWLFATGSVDLGAGQESGDAEFPVKYEKPSTMIRIIAIDDGSGSYAVKFERRGDEVFTEGELDQPAAPTAPAWDSLTPYALGTTVNHLWRSWRALADSTGVEPVDGSPVWEAIPNTSSRPTYAKAVSFVDDPKVWTPTFCRAVAARIAADLAGTLTENVGLGERMEAKYRNEISRAGALDGSNATSRPVQMRTTSATLRR